MKARVVAWLLLACFCYGAFAALRSWHNPFSVKAVSALPASGAAFKFPSCADHPKDCTP